MIYKRFIDKRFYTQNNTVETQKIVNFIKNNKLLFKEDLVLTYLNKIPNYDFSNYQINIPNNFFKTDSSYQQLICIETFFKEQTLRFIIHHEIGHFNHHKFLNKITHENFNSQSNYIKSCPLLNNLLNRTLVKDNPVNDFIHMNFIESYADAYAGLTSYLYDKKLDIFNKITNFRKHKLTQLKDFFPKTKLNQDDFILEIQKGKFSTSRYSNFLVSEYLQNNIVKTFSFEQLNSLTIDNLHALLQIEVLKSLNQTLKNEINKNPLFSNDFNKYLLIKNISVETYFNTFEIGIKEYQDQTILNIIQSSFINHNKDLLVDFIDFHVTNKFQQYTFKVPLVTPIEESEITSLILEDINYGNQINHLNFSKFITSKYILPINELDSFMSYLEQKDKSNPKFNEISKSLSPDLINSLIQYNKLLISNPALPQVTSCSQQAIIDLITEKLSAKEKKQFIDYIEKNNIKEITTAYLTSSDFNVANYNSDEKQFKLKSKQDILFKIISIESKIKTHNEDSPNDIKKLKK